MFKLLGVLGKNLGHSFSPQYFAGKFEREHIHGFEYHLFPLESIHEFPAFLEKYPNLVGFNVTIPYKTEILPFINELTLEVETIGAANVVKIQQVQGSKKLFAYNTDVIGFEKSLVPLLEKHHQKALILGTGGASKAVAFVLNKLGIEFLFVSRNLELPQTISYLEITHELLNEYTLVVNTTPLGMYPNINTCVEIPFQYISNKHLFYDLIYNPQKTLFLEKAEKQGAKIKDGLEMLHLQAEAAWDIWYK